MSQRIIGNIQLLNRSRKCLSYLNSSKIITCGCGGDQSTKRHFSAFRQYDTEFLHRKKSHRTFLSRDNNRNFGTNVFGNFIEICEAQFVLLHEFTGLPWWATIVVCTVPLRITLSYVIYKYGIKMKYKKHHVDTVIIPRHMQDVKIQLQQPQYKHFNRDMKEKYLKAKAYQVAKSLYKEHKVNQYTVIMLSLTPIVVWLSYSMAVWNICGVERGALSFIPMTSLHAISPDLHYEGLFWFKDLVAMDPYHILPVLCGLFFAASSELSVLSLNPRAENDQIYNKTQRITKGLCNFFTAWSILCIYFFWSRPSALVLYWCTSGCVGLACKLIMMHPDFERRCIPDDVHFIEESNKLENIRKNMKLRYNPSYWFLK